MWWEKVHHMLPFWNPNYKLACWNTENNWSSHSFQRSGASGTSSIPLEINSSVSLYSDMPTSLNQPSNKFLFWPRNSRDCFCDFHPKHPSHHISHWAICINHFYKTQESSTQHFRYSNICFIKKKFLYNILMCQTKLNPKHFMSIMGWTSPVWEELTALWSCSVTVRWQLILLKDHFLYLAKMCFFVFLSSWPCSAIHHTE